MPGNGYGSDETIHCSEPVTQEIPFLAQTCNRPLCTVRNYAQFIRLCWHGSNGCATSGHKMPFLPELNIVLRRAHIGDHTDHAVEVTPCKPHRSRSRSRLGPFQSHWAWQRRRRHETRSSSICKHRNYVQSSLASIVQAAGASAGNAEAPVHSCD